MKPALPWSAWSLAAGLALSSLMAPALAARPALPDPEGQVIVKFKADADTVRQYALSARAEGGTVRSALAGRAGALGTRVGRALQAGASVGPRTQVVRASGISAAALAARLAADPDVEYAVPDAKVRIATAPNDPLYLTGPTVSGGRGGPVSGQWYLRAPTSAVVSSIDIEAAWARTQGSATIVVAVLDTGVRFEHPDLGRVASGGKLLPGYDFVSATDVANDGDGRDADPSDPGDYTTAAENSEIINGVKGTFWGCDPSGTGRAVGSASSWHGTNTASLVGAATGNGIGMAGTAPNVRVLPVRVLGKCFGNRSDIMAGMRWAAGIHVDGVPDNPNPAKVLNMSLGGGTCNAAYQEAVNDVIAAGATIVASAGNSEGGALEAPANCTGVIGVTALRHVGTKVGFSSIGPEAVIAAPGGNCVNNSGACLYPILVATNSGSQQAVSSTWSDSYDATYGTSYSSPLVAGVVALMLSQQPALTPAQVRAAITSTARHFPTSGGTAGIPQCQAPSASTVQDECYCTTSTCGAGMLDAGAAVAAVGVAAPTARIRVSPATPTAGAVVTLSASGSTPTGSSTITGYDWTITDGGGIVSGFNGSASSVTATLTPAASGSFTVTLAVQDGLANIALASQTVVVAGTPQTITFNSPGNQTLGTAPPALAATASSGLLVNFSSGTTAVCTVSGSTLTLVAAGTCTLTATQAGNAVYAAAPAVSQSFTVAAVVTVNGGGGGGGGGALSVPWLALLALAVVALFRAPRRA
jgi:serine protease